ncbi:MAG: thiamine-phosphate kinase [Armatimonadetes bacterium]|nr:thiamine-phosphate kinase [Armatimonadota bacterium]
MPPERVGDVGEFGLLARLRRRLASAFLGDDTAVLPAAPGFDLLATVDVQVDGVHFLRDRMSPQQIGRRAIAVNISDIAAMGGEPRYALISLLLPAALEVAWVEQMYDGLRDEAARWGATIAGGNISSTPGPLAIDVVALGQVEEGQALRRSGARPGDLLLVTGSLGRSSAGLRLLQRGEGGVLVEAYCTPTPRVREGRALVRTRRVHAAMDLSDGLASDLHRLCEESGVGAVVEVQGLPVDAGVRAAAATLGADPVDLALYGGEDFELLVAAPRDDVGVLVEAVREAGTAVSVIGEVRPPAEGVTLRLPDGVRRPLAGGWDHFARNA